MDSRPLLYFDHDGVLADFMNPFLAYVNRTEGLALRLQDLRTYQFEESWGRTREWWRDKTMAFCGTEELDGLPPIPGALDGLQALEQKFRLGILTSRSPTLYLRTLDYVARTFPVRFERIDFSLPYTADGDGKTKGAWAAELGAAGLIEDADEYARDAVAHGIRAWLIRQPWTERVSDIPVKNWPDLVDELLAWRDGPSA